MERITNLLLAALYSLITVTSAVPISKAAYSPSGPIKNTTVDICHDGNVKFVADADNLCWFWECTETVHNDAINIQLFPRRCALGSKMPYSYDFGLSNPCSVNFNTKIYFECTRAQDFSVHKEPECFKDYVCHNNGTATYDGPICWCNCPDEWSGNFDCSEPKKKPVVRNITANATECFQKEPPCDLANGCENNGICHNLCGDFWCECPVPFTNGKRCEGFSCEANPCKNGGTCNRGASGIREVSRCLCPPGFRGFLCEFSRAPLEATARRPVQRSTQAPVTLPPVTRQPARRPQVTQRRVTLPPVTQPPVTLPPVTRQPARRPQVTQRRVTLPPVTQRRVTLPPVTRQPARRPPVTLPPVTLPPVTQRPVTQRATQRRATQRSATQSAIQPPINGGNQQQSFHP